MVLVFKFNHNKNYLPTFGNGSDIDMPIDRFHSKHIRSYGIKSCNEFCGEPNWKAKEVEVFALSDKL